MAALLNFNGLASCRKAENSLQSVNLTMPFIRRGYKPYDHRGRTRDPWARDAVALIGTLW